MGTTCSTADSCMRPPICFPGETTKGVATALHAHSAPLLLLGAGRRVAEGAGELGEVAAGDAELLEQGVEQRRLGTVAERAVDDVVGDIAAAFAARRRRAAAEAVDLQDLDALDLLQWAHAFADD